MGKKKAIENFLSIGVKDLGYMRYFLLLILFFPLAAQDVVFVIASHLRNAEDGVVLKRCYNSIRKFYPNHPIVIIDDNSPYAISQNAPPHTTVIRSQYPGAGELLPYFYFLEHRWADKMVFLHDSMYLKRPFTFEELHQPVKFHWHFDRHRSDENDLIIHLLSFLKNSVELMRFNANKGNWNGCFGVASIIDLTVLEDIERKYAFTQALITKVNSRTHRKSLERIFGILLFKEGYVNKKNCSNFGSIHDYPFSFQKVNEEVLKNIELSYPGAILKTWHGR